MTSTSPTTNGVSIIFNQTLEDEDTGFHEFSNAEIVLWFVLYSFIACLAVIGNSTVVYIIATRKRMQNVTNYFIANLASADALTGLFAIPFKFQAALLQRWDLPPFMCHVAPFIETVTLSVSVFVLTATTCDRFCSVVFQKRTKMSRTWAAIILTSIWFCSIVVSIPYGVHHKYGYAPWDGVTPICSPKEVHWMTWWKYYNVYLTIIQYFVPLVVINVAYAVIGYKILRTQIPDRKDKRQRAFEKSRRKVIKLLIIVVTVFTFCWLPYETYLVLSEIRENVNMYRYINIIFFCCHCLAMSNSCLNPIIYGIYNDKFRREYKWLLFRCCGRTTSENTTKTCTTGNNNDNGNDDDGVEEMPLPDVVTTNYIVSELGKDDSDEEENLQENLLRRKR